ncbi:MAG: DUF4465 domain-containing protein [Bacteroidota bacterium]
MKYFFTTLLIFGLGFLNAQTTTDFETFDLSAGEFLNGSDNSGGFEADNVFLPNTFTVFPEFTTWSGWSISADTNTTMPGFMNQYSAITGSGFEESTTYAVSFSGTNLLELRGEAAGKVVDGMYVTNGTYPYLSMRDGDGFAKKFGGLTGDDPDFFLLTIKKYFEGELSADSINFYLADYRFEDNSQDYIVDEWTYIDLTALGNADSLQFTLTSTDVGQFGMNTPAYFCMDNFTTKDQATFTRAPKLELNLNIFPNPTADYLNFNWQQHQGIVQVIDLQGRILLEQILQKGNNQIDANSLVRGIYHLQFVTKEGVASKRFVKQ